MQSSRSATTGRLADIIHIIHMGERTGMLTVERGEGMTVEEGFIAFINGQVVEANINQQSGLAAFNYLNSWQECRFSFTTQSLNGSAPLRQITQPLAPLNGHVANAPPSDRMARITGNLPEKRNMPEMPFNAPSRLQAGEETLQSPELNGRLPRIHRRLLLLVNGQRSVSELARLMVRRTDELQALLNELERSGLIRQ